jgi:hypothetical protein
MDSLGKISLIISIVGIICLFFVSENFEFTLKGTNNITENKNIKLDAKVVDVNKYDDSIIFELETKCYVTGFYYDNKNKTNMSQIKKLKNKNIEITGVAMNSFNPDISISSFKTS